MQTCCCIAACVAALQLAHLPPDGKPNPQPTSNLALPPPLSHLQVFPRPVTPAYFAACSPYISDSLAALLHSRLKQRGLLDSTDMVAGGWAAGRAAAGRRLGGLPS